MHGCDPGRVSDGSRLALCQTLSIECPSSIFFWHVYFAILVSFSLSFLFVCVFLLLSLELGRCSCPLISFCPADHVPDWQPRVVLVMVEARSVNVKKTTTTHMNKVSGSTTVKCFFFCYLPSLLFPVAHLVRNLLTRLDASSNPGTWDLFFFHTK